MPQGSMTAEETPYREYPDKPFPEPFLVRPLPDLGDTHGVPHTAATVTAKFKVRPKRDA